MRDENFCYIIHGTRRKHWPKKKKKIKDRSVFSVVNDNPSMLQHAGSYSISTPTSSTTRSENVRFKMVVTLTKESNYPKLQVGKSSSQKIGKAHSHP